MQARQYNCRDEKRKLEIARHDRLTGIDYLEVSENQEKLCIHFIPSLVKEKKPIPDGISIINFSITGASTVTNVQVVGVEDHQPKDNRLTIAVKDCTRQFADAGDLGPGDNRLKIAEKGGGFSRGVGGFSTYTLKLVNLDNIDPIFSKIDFSFKAGCPKDSDCREVEAVCLAETVPEPHLDYLARDYSGFRRLILDRLSQIMPGWKESSVSDLGVVVAEIMAYAADYLAYYQDAVATEAYLGTARKRISVRRHARLLDYFLHEGCNSRVWVTVEVEGSSADGQTFPGKKGYYVAGQKNISGRDSTNTLFNEFLTVGSDIDLSNNAMIERTDNGEAVKITAGKNSVLLRLNDESSVGEFTDGNKTVRLIAEMEDDGLEIFSIKKVRFLTKVEQFKDKTVLSSKDEYDEAIILGAEVFEPVNSIKLHSSQNEMLFYTWGEQDCCLPKNATCATLVIGGEKDDYPVVGDVLIFEELPRESWEESSKKSRQEESARESREISAKLSAEKFANEPAEESTEGEFGYFERRHAVRLTKVERVDDKLIDYVEIYRDKEPYKQFADDIHLINIEWCAKDALPFPLCISRASQTASCAHGNVLLADHGRTLEEYLDEPEINKRYRPKLKNKLLTHRANPKTEQLFREQLDGDLISASEILSQDGTGGYPAIALNEISTGREWSPQRDLLNSSSFDRAFVAEIDDDGFAVLRFGDGKNGMKPFAGLKAKYRVGNGLIGNVGADSIGHIYIEDETLPYDLKIRNPLHAEGGKDPETVDHARLFAPQSLHEKEYAVNEEDYAELAKRHADVQKAVATLRWTGSWNTMFINVDRKGGRPVDASFKNELLSFLNRFCLAGFDLEVQGPVYVPLDIELKVFVRPDYFSAGIKESLQEEFSCRQLSDGRVGFFFPDEFTFGNSVYLSRLIARAIKVPGVLRVEAIRFQRMGEEANGELGEGEIKMGRLEIARLDGDTNRPENGVIKFIMEGGR